TVTVDDGDKQTVRTFTVTVNPVNDAPTLTVPGAQSASEDVNKAIGGLKAGDPDNSNLKGTLAVGHGQLTLKAMPGLCVTGNGTSKVCISGNIANMNAALACLVYRGCLNYSGSDTLNITASDGSLSSSASVALTVLSAAQQAANLQAQVAALRNAGLLNQGQ